MICIDVFYFEILTNIIKRIFLNITNNIAFLEKNLHKSIIEIMKSLSQKKSCILIDYKLFKSLYDYRIIELYQYDMISTKYRISCSSFFFFFKQLLFKYMFTKKTIRYMVKNLHGCTWVILWFVILVTLTNHNVISGSILSLLQDFFNFFYTCDIMVGQCYLNVVNLHG